MRCAAFLVGSRPSAHALRCAQHEEDREAIEQSEYMPHYVTYNASLRIFYGQNWNYLLEPHDVADRAGVDAFLEKLLKETGHHIPDYPAERNMARQMYVRYVRV